MVFCLSVLQFCIISMLAQQSELNIKYEVKISILMNALLIGLLISLKYDTIAVKREQMYLTI